MDPARRCGTDWVERPSPSPQAVADVMRRVPPNSLTRESAKRFSRMTEVISEVLPGHPAGVLAGPNLAKEILDGYAAAALVAMPDLHVAAAVQEIFRSSLFRVYTGTDVCGAEIAGALKNVFAIAACIDAGSEPWTKWGAHP